MKKFLVFLLAIMAVMNVNAQTRLTLGGQSANGNWSWGTTKTMGASVALNFSSQWGEFKLASDPGDAVGCKLVVAEPNAKVNIVVKFADGSDTQYIAVDATEKEVTFPSAASLVELQGTEAGADLEVKSFVLVGSDGTETQTTYSEVWGVSTYGGIFTSTSQWAQVMLNGAEQTNPQVITFHCNAPVPAGLQLKVIYTDNAEDYLPLTEGETVPTVEITKATKEVSLQFTATDLTIDIAYVTTEPKATAWHLCGDFNSWNPENTDVSFYPTDDATKIVAKAASFSLGQWGFKVLGATDWSGAQYGATSDDAVVTANGDAMALTGTDAKNIYVNEKNVNYVLTNAVFTITLDADGNPATLAVACDDATVPVVVDEYMMVGTWQGWSFENNPLKFTYDETNKNYTASIDQIYGDWKIVKNNSWDNALGGGGTDLVAGNTYNLVPGGDNTAFAATINNAKFTLTVAEDGSATLKVEGDNAETETTYGLVGEFNGWSNTDENSLMTKQEDGTYTIHVTDFPCGKAWKVSHNKSWKCFLGNGTDNTVTVGTPYACVYGDNNNNLSINGEGTFTGTITLSDIVAETSATITLTADAPVAAGTIVSFGSTSDARFDAQTQMSGVASSALTCADGNTVTVESTKGKYWSHGIVGTWTNETAVAEMNEVLGSELTSADFAEGSPVTISMAGAQGNESTLTFDFAGQTEGEQATIYTTVSYLEPKAPLDNITVTGLIAPEISYAVGDGEGFVSTPTFCSATCGLTLVKIVGYLTADKKVVVSSTSSWTDPDATDESAALYTPKVGYQVAGYKVVDAGPAPEEPTWTAVATDYFPEGWTGSLFDEAGLFNGQITVEYYEASRTLVAKNFMGGGKDITIAFDEDNNITTINGEEQDEYGSMWASTGNETWYGCYIYPEYDTYVDLDPQTGYAILSGYYYDNGEYAWGAWRYYAFTWDQEIVTGLNGVKANADDNAPVYNVAGQRVKASTKGIVIKNGKKYIVK